MTAPGVFRINLYYSMTIDRRLFLWRGPRSGRGKGEGFDQDISRLEIRSGAEGETFLTVVEFLRSDFRDEAYLLPRTPVDESDSVLLLHFGAVSDT